MFSACQAYTLYSLPNYLIVILDSQVTQVSKSAAASNSPRVVLKVS